MVTKKLKGLGMGLEALLGPRVGETGAAADAAPTSLALERLRPGKYQPRTIFKEEKLNGFFILKDEPDLKKFTWHRWFDGSFQDLYSKGTEDHIGQSREHVVPRRSVHADR